MLSEILLIIKLISNTIMLTITILAPVGIFNNKEINTPTKKQRIDIIDDKNIRLLKLLTNFLAIKAENIIKLDINNVPIILMPTTTVSAVRRDIKN